MSVQKTGPTTAAPVAPDMIDEKYTESMVEDVEVDAAPETQRVIVTEEDVSFPAAQVTSERPYPPQDRQVLAVFTCLGVLPPNL